MCGARVGESTAFDTRLHNVALWSKSRVAGGAVPLSAVTPEFSASLGQLRRIIAGYLASPHTFAGQGIFGGQRINDIVRGLCKSINDTGKICPPRLGIHHCVLESAASVASSWVVSCLVCHCVVVDRKAPRLRFRCFGVEQRPTLICVSVSCLQCFRGNRHGAG